MGVKARLDFFSITLIGAQVPVFQQLVNYTELFHQLSEPPVIINDLANTFEQEKENVKNLITTRFSSDMIDLLPSCQCGVTKGVFSVGVTCSYCDTIVKSSIISDIEPTVWFRKPNGVSNLINLVVLSMLRKRFTKSGYDVIQWLIDSTYRSNVKQPQIVSRLIEDGIPRGYNNFVENFDRIITHLFTIKDFKPKKKQHDYLKDLLEQNRHLIFSEYIPLPNKSLIIIDKTDLGIFVDPNIVQAVDVIEMLVSIDKNFYDQTAKVKENRTAKALIKLSDFYEDYEKKSVCPKPGQFRRHIFGSRTNFAFRAVISSLTDTHSYDEIHVPWGIGLTCFKPHILNKLMKLGMDVNSANGLILGHVNKYHPMLDRLLQELIDETPTKGIVVIAQRNPSLLQASAQRVRITKFKKDPLDYTVSLSILIVKGFNAD